MNASGASAGRRPRILYLHRYPPETEALQFPALQALAERLAARYEVIYLSLRGPRPPDAALRSTMRVIEAPWRVDQTRGLDKWMKTGLYYGLLPWWKRRIRSERPDVVFCKETLPSIPARIARLGIPTIAEASDWWWSILLGGTSWGRRTAGALERREVRQWDRLGVRAIAHTQAEARLIEEKGLRPDRITVINAPSAPGIFRPCDNPADRSAWGEGVWVAAIHGIIRPGKGYEQLLQWWAAAARRHPHWRLLIIGGAGGEAWLRRMIGRLGLREKVIVTGWLPAKEDVNRHLNAADVLLVIRRNSPDNWGVVPSALFNSLSTGRPTLSVGLPGIAETIRDGIDGYLFEPDQPEAFIAALERIEAEPEAARRIGLAGRERARECFCIDAAVASYERLIQNVVASGISG